MSLDQQELAQLATLIGDEIAHHDEVKDAERLERIAKRRSAKRLRRVILVMVVLFACATTHWIVESNEVQWLAQSFELILAAFFEGLFGTVRE